MNNNEFERQKEQMKEDLAACMSKCEDMIDYIETLEKLPVIQGYINLRKDLEAAMMDHKKLHDMYIDLLQKTCIHPIWITDEDSSIQDVHCSCIECGLGKCLKRDEFSNIITVDTPDAYVYIQQEYWYLQKEEFSNEEAVQLIKKRYTKKKSG